MNADKVKVGVAPINWSNDDLPELGGNIPLEQCLDEMQEAHFDGCEVGIKFPKDPHVLKPMLDKRNLVVCNSWANYRFTTESFNTVKSEFIALLTFLRAMGSHIVGGGEVGTSIQGDFAKSLYEEKPNNTPAQWKLLTRGLDELGKIAREEYDIKLCFHHHMGTCVQTIEETEILLHETNPDYVWLNYDCGHFFASHNDPVEAANKFSSRIGHVHIKDVRALVMEQVEKEHLSFLDGVLRGFFTVPTDDSNIGVDAFVAIFGVLDATGYEGWIVLEAEQDPQKAPPLQYAKMGRDFIKRYAGI